MAKDISKLAAIKSLNPDAQVEIINDEIEWIDTDPIADEAIAEEQERLAELAANKEVRDSIRNSIYESAGDVDSLLGTTADGVQLLLFAFSQMTVALNKANSLAEVREAAAPFNDLATGFLSKVEAGDVKLPFQAKGLESVVSDIETRATAVTEVLVSNG